MIPSAWEFYEKNGKITCKMSNETNNCLEKEVTYAADIANRLLLFMYFDELYNKNVFKHG